MPRGPSSRVNERNFMVREYAQWLNAMSDHEYDALRDGYNARAPRRIMESFEGAIRSLDRELEEYLQMNRAAGFRSSPGPQLMNEMLSMWLQRDTNGEPTAGAADVLRTNSERAGFEKLEGQEFGSHRGAPPNSSRRGGNSSAQRLGSPPRDSFRPSRGGDLFNGHRGGQDFRSHRGEPLGPSRRGGYDPHPRRGQPSLSPFGPSSFGNGFADDLGGSTRRRHPVHQPSRGGFGSMRQGGAPPIPDGRNRPHAEGPSRRSAKPSRGQRSPSAVEYSEDESEDDF